MKRHIIISVTAALVTLSLANCVKRQTTSQAPRIIPVKVMDVGVSNNSHSRNYVGTVEEAFAVSPSFSSPGTVERVLVSEGERVRKGQLLAVLNSSTAQNTYDVAKSTLNQAQDAYDRMKPLYEKGSLTEIKWVEIETGLEKAKAMKAIAGKSVEDCRLSAPTSGIISKRLVEEGVNVMPGMPAFKLVSIEEVDISVPVSENEIAAVRIGQPVTITVAALGDRKYTGVVNKKGVEANPVSRTYDIKIRLKNPRSELMPGMVCKAFLQSGEDERIIIPNKSVQIAPDNRRFVWLAEGDSARRRFITTGQLSDYGIVVEEGLSAGDRLIVEGCSKVSEGMQISITQ